MLIGAGAFQSIVALVLLLAPQTMIDVWPWMLTPLTAQTLGGWFALPGITAVMMGLDGRPSAIRITLHSQVIGLVLILVAVARAWDDIDASNALSYVLVAGLASAARRPAGARRAPAQARASAGTGMTVAGTSGFDAVAAVNGNDGRRSRAGSGGRRVRNGARDAGIRRQRARDARSFHAGAASGGGRGATIVWMSSDLRWGRRYLMCPPAHFDVTYAINPWMDITEPVDRELAQRQWDALVATLRAAGAEIEVLEPLPGLPDLVFTANLGIVDGATFVPARMRHAERRPETAHATRWFADHGFAIRSLSRDVTQEGAGDALPFGDTLVAGHRSRSSAGAYVELGRIVDGAILPLELADPRFYHVDITFCPLDASTAIYAPGALGEEGAAAVAEARCPTRSR